MVATVSWLSPVPRMQMTIACEEGTVVFDDKARRQLVLHGRGGEVSHPAYSDELPLTRELGAFLRAVGSGGVDPLQIEMGFSVVRAIAAAHESMALEGHALNI
jgi:predicted dehydrogenase